MVVMVTLMDFVLFMELCHLLVFIGCFSSFDRFLTVLRKALSLLFFYFMYIVNNFILTSNSPSEKE
jgi:hypothetical protein